MKLKQNRLERLKSISKFYPYYGLPFIVSFLKHRNQKSVMFYGKEISYTSQFWFLHSLQEIFIDQVYLFKSKKNTPLIIDCGANIGLSIIYFKQLFPDSRIVGFEPDPKNFEVLKRNVAQFSLKQVELINKAVWSHDEQLRFDSSGSIGSKLVEQNINSPKTIVVEAVALKNYLMENEKIDFLKIDIEGAEYEVLLSCKDQLINVENLFIEYHSLPTVNQDLPDILGILREAGFRFYIKEAWENLKHPFLNQETIMYDLQLNIFAYR